jgi:hypothetical protein
MSGWFAKALANFQSPFVDPHLNYPGQLLLAATDIPYAGFVLISPLAWLSNPILAYNAWIFISYLLSGYFTYLWIQRLTSSRFAGIAAGLIFLLTPYRVVHSYGHLQLVSTQFIPLFFWSLDRAVLGPNLKRILILAGATFLLSSGSAQYYLIICLLSGVFYVLLLKPDFQFLFNQGWKLITAVGIGAGIGSLPYLTAASGALYEPYAIEETRLWSASLADYLFPSRLHPIWGAWIEKIYPRKTWIEHTLYPGILAIVLAIVGVIYSDPKHKRRNFTWIGIALIGLILSLGTDLHLYLGKPIQETNPFWLPAYYLGQLPIIEHMRTWSRFAIIPIFFIALLAGIGVDSLYKNKNLSTSMLVLILILIFIDLVPGRIEATRVEFRTIDKWISQQSHQGAVAFLPAGVDNYAAMYGSLLHEKMLPAYNHPSHLPEEFLQFAGTADMLPSTVSLNELKEQGYRYLIFSTKFYNGDFYPEWEVVKTGIEQSQEIEFIDEIDGFIIAEFKTGQ